MAPAYAVPRMLRDAKLTLQDFDFYEIHEAFAGQVLCTLKGLDRPGLLPRQARTPGRTRHHRFDRNSTSGRQALRSGIHLRRPEHASSPPLRKFSMKIRASAV